MNLVKRKRQMPSAQMSKVPSRATLPPQDYASNHFRSQSKKLNRSIVVKQTAIPRTQAASPTAQLANRQIGNFMINPSSPRKKLLQFIHKKSNSGVASMTEKLLAPNHFRPTSKRKPSKDLPLSKLKIPQKTIMQSQTFDHRGIKNTPSIKTSLDNTSQAKTIVKSFITQITNQHFYGVQPGSPAATNNNRVGSPTNSIVLNPSRHIKPTHKKKANSYSVKPDKFPKQIIEPKTFQADPGFLKQMNKVQSPQLVKQVSSTLDVPSKLNQIDSDQVKQFLARFYNKMNEKSRSSSPNNFLENKTTEKLYDVIEKVKQRSVVKKAIVNTKTPPKENLDESDICYIDSTRTDPLLTEKQQLVTIIYNTFQEFNKYVGTMQTFYRTGRVLGEGTYGKVILAQHKLTSHFVAIKCYKKDYFEAFKSTIKQEMHILSKLNHQHVIMLLDSFETRSHMCFVMEMCGGGDLLSYIRRRKRLDEPTAIFFFKQAAHAVKYLHDNNVVHRNIKPDNILLQEEGNLKLSDFCQSRNDQGSLLSDYTGSTMFMAPEVVQQEAYLGQPSDIWSLGVLLFIMLVGRPPFEHDNHKELAKLISSAKYEIPSRLKLSPPAISLIKACLCLNPNKRPTAAQILQHPWFVLTIPVSKQKIFTQAEQSKLYLVQQTNVNSGEPVRLLTEMDLSQDGNSNRFKARKDSLANVSERSVIYAPFNTTIVSLQTEPRVPFIIENTQVQFSKKVREANRQYEFNYNGDVDNGMVIAQQDLVQSSKVYARPPAPLEQLITAQEIRTRVQQHNTVQSKSDGYDIEPRSFLEEKPLLSKLTKQPSVEAVAGLQIDMLIVCKIENEFGYPEQFIVDSLQNNIKNDATTCYYLFRQEDKDEIVNLL